jgi:hypothetical protein
VAQGKNQKSRPRGGLCAYIPVFGHEVNENVSHSGCRDDREEELSRLTFGKLGKTEKRDSSDPADSCHGVSR